MDPCCAYGIALSVLAKGKLVGSYWTEAAAGSGATFCCSCHPTLRPSRVLCLLN